MDFFIENVNLVLFLPLIVCLILGFNGLISNKIENGTLFSIVISITTICLIFCLPMVNYTMAQNHVLTTNTQWLTFENISFYFGTLLDKTSTILFLISAILTIILQIYTYTVLKENKDYSKLVFYINLFFLGLNGIFISSNLFQTYLFCELIGVASYLLISFDFSNREQSKAGIKSFIYNRTGDLALLFCILVILYFSVIYNELSLANVLSYASLNNVAASINSLMSEGLYLFFSALLIFVVTMKFIQAFIYISFESKIGNKIAQISLIQNTSIVLIGIYLFIRLEPFFFATQTKWFWLIPILVLIFVALGIINKLFIPMCKALSWIEKYIIETIINILELIFRFLSFFSNRLQGVNFQTYILYSFIGLITIFIFILIFYNSLIKI